MRISALVVLAAMVLGACSSDDASQNTEIVKVSDSQERSTPLRRDSRKRLVDGRTMDIEEIMALAEDFSEKMEGITLVEAKECRILLYSMSGHFDDEREDGFDGDFRAGDRSEAFAQKLAFLYFGFDRAVKRLEIEQAIANLGNAPESIKKQVIREGIEHSTAENLIWCDYESLQSEDMDTISYKNFCAHYDDINERRRVHTIWKSFHKYCFRLESSYLKDGVIDPEIYAESVLR